MDEFKKLDPETQASAIEWVRFTAKLKTLMRAIHVHILEAQIHNAPPISIYGPFISRNKTFYVSVFTDRHEDFIGDLVWKHDEESPSFHLESSEEKWDFSKLEVRDADLEAPTLIDALANNEFNARHEAITAVWAEHLAHWKSRGVTDEIWSDGTHLNHDGELSRSAFNRSGELIFELLFHYEDDNMVPRVKYHEGLDRVLDALG